MTRVFVEGKMDPRLHSLGHRFIANEETFSEMAYSEGSRVSPIEYKAWRIQQGVAEGRREIPSNRNPFF